MPLNSHKMAAAKKREGAKAPPPPEEMSDLPGRLKRAMKSRGVDQVTLAKLSGVSQPAISQLSRGESLDGVTASVVARLALALRIPSGWLLTAEGDVVPRVVERVAGRGPVVELEEDRDPLVPATSRPPPSFPAREEPSQRSR